MKKLLLGLVVGLGLAGCDQPPSNKIESEKNINQTGSHESKNGKWKTIVHEDEMRGTKSKWLALRSDNNANLDFPYDGENHLNLDILDSKTGKPRIFLTIDKGQYDCDEYGCYLPIKFGNSEIQTLTFKKYETQGSDETILIFSQNSQAFLQNIRNFRTMVVEIPFYRSGTRQFKFDLSNFNDAEKEI